MPAPAGFKTFVAGAVLSATSDVQVYLMDQVVTVWNDASARTSGLASPAGNVCSTSKTENPGLPTDARRRRRSLYRAFRRLLGSLVS